MAIFGGMNITSFCYGVVHEWHWLLVGINLGASVLVLSEMFVEE